MCRTFVYLPEAIAAGSFFAGIGVYAIVCAVWRFFTHAG